MSDYTEALSLAAQILDDHPDLPSPCVWGYSSSQTVELEWQIHRDDHAEQKATARKIARAVGGKWDKNAYTDTFYLEQKRGALTLRIVAAREAVCERVVVGTETVTIPATEAQVIDAQPSRTEEREVVEWRCEPLLAEAAS